MIPCHNQSSCFHLHSCHILLKVPPTPSSVPPGPSSHYCQIKLSKIYLCNAVLFLNISRLLQHQWHGAQVPWAAQPGPVVTCSCPLPLSCLPHAPAPPPTPHHSKLLPIPPSDTLLQTSCTFAYAAYRHQYHGFLFSAWQVIILQTQFRCHNWTPTGKWMQLDP